MKIYDVVVMSMATGKTVYEESHDYCGPIAECKGGGTYDKAYNQKLAELAEKEFGLSSRAFDSWYSGGGRALEEGTAKAGLSLLPAQTRLASAQIESASSLLPGETALSAGQTALGLQKVENQSGIMDDFYDQLGKHDPLTEMNAAGATMAGSFVNQTKADEMSMQRRGVGYKPSAGLSLEKAKAVGGAMTMGLDTAKTKNLQELAMGLS